MTELRPPILWRLSAEAARTLGAELCSLEEVFERADMVSLPLPDLLGTRGLIGADLLSRLRDGSTLINTARGRVLDQSAVANECQSGRIFAALDVTDPEPLPPSSPLWQGE